MPLLRLLVSAASAQYQQHQQSKADANNPPDSAATSGRPQSNTPYATRPQSNPPTNWQLQSQQHSQQAPQQSQHPSRNSYQRPLQDQYDDPPPAYGQWEEVHPQNLPPNSKVHHSVATAQGAQASAPSSSQPAHTILSYLDSVVLLPQRRSSPAIPNPGFIRAYAPVLEDKDIDEATLNNFIETFNGRCNSSSWLHATNFASLGAHGVPPALALPIAIIVAVASDASLAQNRHNINDSLIRLNQQYFLPRDLYCLVATYKPTASAVSVTVDIASAEDRNFVDGGGDGESFRFRHDYAGPDGPEYEYIPDPAVLLFTSLDQIATANGADERSVRASLSGDTTVATNQAQSTDGGGGRGGRRGMGRGMRGRGGLIGGLVQMGVGAMSNRGGGRGGQAGRGGQGTGHGSQQAANPDSQVPGLFKLLRENEILYLAIVDVPDHQHLVEAQEALIHMDPGHAQHYADAVRAIEQGRSHN